MNSSANFPAEFNLADLNGQNGFVVRGIEPYDFSGRSVSDAGDINGDGIGDIVIGATGADPNDAYSGQSYVVFGRTSGFGQLLDLATLDGSDGFILNGISESDQAGLSVSGADVIIGAGYASNDGGALGESYIVFGSKSSFEREIELSSLNGTNGFVVKGVGQNNAAGISVSGAGDINGDGIDDVIIGAQDAFNPPENSGESYVLYGRASGFDAELALSTLNSDTGFLITANNTPPSTRLNRYAVSGAGDVNGDGFDDFVVGIQATSLEPGTNVYSYTATGYVVFGRPSELAEINLSTLDSNDGFAFTTADVGPAAAGALSVSGAGDINGDGFDDIVVRLGSTDTNNESSGGIYVVFGSGSGFSRELKPTDLDGNNGFIIRGRTPSDGAGFPVSDAGDINGDGIDDLVIGAARAGRPNDDLSYAGEGYVLFGSTSGFERIVELSDLDGSNGFVIKASDDGGSLGLSASGAGDVNGDGIDDVIIGANRAPIEIDRYSAGESYVVFGRNTPVEDDGSTDEPPTISGQPATAYVNNDGIVVGAAFQSGTFYTGQLSSNTDGTNSSNDVMVGTDGFDNIWSGVEGNDRIAGGAGNDIIGFGLGNAQVDAGSGNDIVYAVSGGAGDNVIDLGRGLDRFYAVAGNNNITGAGTNTIGIGTGNDTVTTFTGNDFIYSVNGGGGKNRLNLGRGLNNVWVEKGDYDIISTFGFNKIGLGNGTDTVTLNGGGAVVYMVDANGENDGNKTVVTGSNNDYIQTGSGDDLLDGGSRINTLLGGSGADTFVFREGGINYLQDFELGIDQIRLEDFSLSDLTFSQGVADLSQYVMISNEFSSPIGYVADVTIEAISNSANFV